MTVQEAAAKLEVTPELVYKLCRAGRIAYRRIGLGRGTIRITQEDLDAYLAAVRVDVAQPPEQEEPRVVPMRRASVPDILGAELKRREAAHRVRR